MMIDRAVVMLIPKAPFYEWANAVFPGSPMSAEDMDEYSSYLLNDDILPQEPKAALEEIWEWLFEAQLFSICTDDSTWPQELSWKLFTDWFELKFSTVVYDLIDAPIAKEALD